ncbi:unnamed protein product [Rhizoctonia solani]|uniref:Uncharacterized protein n=1 Tax=Rhizoctonia solani TaxID=456999 RepID=A0A8H3D2H7_9AGAM|nr:unnamed protein product [Rhizoctonia solani]
MIVRARDAARLVWGWLRSHQQVDIPIQQEQPLIEQTENLSSQESGDRSQEYTEGDRGLTVAEESLDHHGQSFEIFNIMPARFPIEIWYIIVIYVTASVGGGSEDSAKYIGDKVNMKQLWNLASVSKFHRQLVLYGWANTIHLLKQDDIKQLGTLGAANGIDLLCGVRRLVCENDYQVYGAPRNAFEGFNFLEELVLSCHSDINFGGDTHPENINDHAESQTGHPDGQPAPQANPNGAVDQHNMTLQQPIRMSYRRLKVKLPSTLRTLKVYDSHVPDIHFIQQVTEQCPLLESLTLARCTIFARKECEFWRRLPRTESDAYFSNQGIASYAAAIGKELKQIQSLKELRIGIYLTKHSAINLHLNHHVSAENSSNTGLEVWEKPCKECFTQCCEETLSAEREATEIIGKQVPTLSSISWANFCSRKRTGWSTHRIMRDDEGKFDRLANVAINLEKFSIGVDM